MTEREPAPTSCEVSWFAALCDDDYRQLGVADSSLRSSWEHCASLVRLAESTGFDNVLLPSGYALGIDPVTFAAGIAAITDRIRLLVAVRAGEMWPPQLARQLASLDQMLRGRLDVNMISSDLPGEEIPAAPRYRRTAEVMASVRTLLDGQRLDLDGEFLRLHVDPPRITTGTRGCPLLYFGGLSEPARDVAAEHADVYLMWPDTAAAVAELIADMTERATRFGRALRFGYRVHVIVRDTTEEALAAAEHLVAALDDDEGARIRARSLDAGSSGVARQSELRDAAGADGFVEASLWTGIGRGRSGCGAAIVGNATEVLAKIRGYQALGIEAFILSGYPHHDECAHFARLVLPHLTHAPLTPSPTLSA